jgi:hypothetical protein
MSKAKDTNSIKEWPDRLKLYAVLATVKSLVETVSENDGFGLESPQEILLVIDAVGKGKKEKSIITKRFLF